MAQLVQALHYKPKGRGFYSRWCHWNFSFQSHYGPGIDAASNRNEYQEYFLGGKSGRCVGLTNLPTSLPIVSKSGSLNFLEPSGLVQGLLDPLFCYTASSSLSYKKMRRLLLGKFANFRKATAGFVMSVRPSVFPHATSPLPLDGFS